MKFGVIVFPGSNCDDDMIHVLSTVMGHEARKVWHKETSLDAHGSFDCICLPGGFSYGDYLRSGAIARLSPIMEDVIRFAQKGGVVFGICNGFQILCETGLLPGALLRNKNQKFICDNVYLKTMTNNSPMTSGIARNAILKIPIAHADGRYHADIDTLQMLEENEQVVFKYCDSDGNVTETANVNGSINNIAGITNEKRNVLGMMPHPERASEDILGNKDGRVLFKSLISILEETLV